MIRKLIRRIGLIMFCCLMFVMPVRAEEAKQSVILKSNGDEVEVALSESNEDVRSLHLNFEIVAVKGKLDTNEVSFVPNEDIQKYVYISEPMLQKDGSNIILDIYASSKQNLLKDGEFVLGAVKLTPKTGSVTAEVEIGSLETVNQMQEMSSNEGTQYKPAQITAGKDDPKPEEPDDNNSQEPGEGDVGDDQKPGEDDGGNDQRPGNDSGEDRQPEESDSGSQSSSSSNSTHNSNNNQIAKNSDNMNNNMPNLIVDNTPQIIIENPPVQESAADQSKSSKPSAGRTSPSHPAAESAITGVEVTEPEQAESQINTDTETDTEMLSENESEPVEQASDSGSFIQIIEEPESSEMGLGVIILIAVVIGVVVVPGVILAVRASKKNK